jgi:glucosamine--fructose-6-phosphate aminotransferase (isomerizing)
LSGLFPCLIPRREYPNGTAWGAGGLGPSGVCRQGGGARFVTDTDADVIAHLVSQLLKNGYEPLDAVHIALLRLEGPFALAFLFEGHENLIIAVCRGYPLAVGYCRGEVYVGSDAIALEPFTDMISYLEDDDIVVMTRQGIEFLNARREFVRRSLAKINGSAGRA